MDLTALAKLAGLDGDPTPVFTGKLTAAQWVRLFEFLGLFHRASGFFVGDAMIECERQMGERSAELISATSLSSEQLQDFARLSERWDQEYRLYELPWSYHRDAGLDMVLARSLVQSALEHGWSRDQLRDARAAVLADIERGIQS